MIQRNATAAVIGAGDYIGAAIARRFATGGYKVFAGRRNGDKFAPLVAEIEKEGGFCAGRTLDARKEEAIAEFLAEAERTAPLEVCIFNVGANVNFPTLETTERVFRKVWEMGCYAGFLTGREAARLMVPAREGLDLFYRRDREHAGRHRLCGIRRRQIRIAGGGAKHGARIRAEEHSRRASDYRLGRRYRFRARAPGETRTECRRRTG